MWYMAVQGKKEVGLTFDQANALFLYIFSLPSPEVSSSYFSKLQVNILMTLNVFWQVEDLFLRVISVGRSNYAVVF